MITLSGHPSTQLPHKMHSLFSMDPDLTIALTSWLMGQFLVHRLQSMHFSASTFKRRAGHPSRFLIFHPRIMNGAIQPSR